jgi:hypothetical protein
MVKKSALLKEQRTKVGPQHLLIFFSLLFVFFVFNMFNLIPWGTAQFVVPLFKPTGEKLEKVGFVKFQGLVWASTSKDKQAMLGGKQVPVSKEYINRDYIFDFTFQKRTMEKDGYVKGANEFYVRSEILGENAIILEPYIGFTILALDVAMLIAVIITILLPTRLGLLALLFDRQIDDTKTKIRLQTGFSDQIVDLLTLPDDKLAEKDFEEVKSAFRIIWNRTMVEDLEASYKQAKFEDFFYDDINIVEFRNFTLYSRIKEFFSDFLVKEILDTKNALLWRRHHSQIFKGLRLYMSHHITEKYQNFVTGMAYGGAAFLIVAVGIRGLKFIPAAKPSFILLAIFLEFTMLSLLAITLMYTEEEERMDKMLKKMEDANRSQLEALRGQQTDIHQLANALVGQTAEIIKTRVEKSIEQYLTSGDKVQSIIAQEIARKIIFGLRESDDEKK